MSPSEDDFDDLSRPSGDGGSADVLAAAVTSALGEAPGRIALEPEDDEMAWLTRDGVRVSRVNVRAATSADPGRRDRFARALSDLVRRYDELWPTIEALEPGREYRVDWKHVKLRRIFRAKAVLIEVSPWIPADGANGGGWTLTLESHPRFGEPSRFHVGTDVLTRIVPA